MSSFAFLSSTTWWRGIAAKAFGRTFWGFGAAAIGLGIACWIVKGPDVVVAAMSEDLRMLLNFLPRVFLALSIAVLIWVLLPRDRMAELVGRDSGLRGLIIALVAGTVTPGGPSSAYSLLAVLGVSGADRGAMVTYIVAWSTLALQRILIWDIPFMGPDFGILRFCVCLPLPILAGLIARRLPITLSIPGHEHGKPESEVRT